MTVGCSSQAAVLTPAVSFQLCHEFRAMTVLSHDRLVEAVNALPPLPDTFIQLQKSFSDPDYEMRDVIRAVQLDPVLTGKALRLANSAAYGNGGVNTTQQGSRQAGLWYCRCAGHQCCKTVVGYA